MYQKERVRSTTSNEMSNTDAISVTHVARIEPDAT